MGHRTAGTKLPSFCLNRVRPSRGGARPPSLRFQRKTEQPKAEEGSEGGDGGGGAAPEGSAGGEEKPEVVGKVVSRKIMVVVDSSAEAKGALQWALTHSVQSDDTLILLHATKPSNQGFFLILSFDPLSFLQWVSILITMSK